MAACALLVSAGMHAQKDVTSLYITNATLSDGTNGWTKTFSKTTQTTNPADAFSNSKRGNNTVGYASEAYAGWGSLIQTAYSMKQTITLPAGNYRLVNYSFFRQGEAYNTNSSKSLAVLKAGDASTPLKTLGSINAAGYANTQAEGANCFDSKMYRNEVEFTIAADNTPIEIGIEGTFDEARSWCIVGMFELFDLDDAASVSSPTDVTYKITNPGFEYRNLTGWTTDPNDGYWYMDNNNWSNAHIGIGWVESWAPTGSFPNRSLSQTLTGLNNGLYEITVLAQGRGGNGFYVYGNNDKTQITDKGDYSVRTTVTDGNLTIKVGTESFGGDWTPVDNFRLKFYGDPLAAYQDLLDAKVTEAQTYINSNPALSSQHIADLQSIVNANDNDDNAFTEESQFNTAIQTIDDALTLYQSMVAPYATFNALKASAIAISDVAYTETTLGSHTTFVTAISDQTTAADNATTVAAITAATTALTAAIKTYIAGAEPTNDGEYFDITCLMTNPNFDDSHNGWTYIDAPGVNWSNCEYYQKEFDINQTVTGLPTGSYSLSVQAFQRPGWAGNVYNDYINGIDNASSVLYINSITSNVKNIAADAQNTYKLGDGSNFGYPNDSQVGSEGSYKYVPNSQQGAKLWFEAGLYDATCAAVVTSEDGGSLKLGFKSTKTHVDGDWTIFDNFRLYYYGSSLFVYYKQYLPQLKSEASADLSNALYVNVTGKEKADFEDAIAATPAEETEAAYKAVIDNIIAKQTAFREAAPTYDALVAAKAETKLDKVTANVGTGVFQYNATTNDNLYTAYETAYNTMMATSAVYSENPYATAANINMALTAYNNRKADYQNQTLNAPDADKRYYLNIVDDGQAWDGYAITFKVGDRGDDGLYNTKYEAPANVNLNQALKFTAVDGEADTYKVSGIRVENGSEQYLTTKLLAYGNGAHGQLRTTDDATKAMRIKIQATTTNGQFKLLNVEANNAVIARNATNPDNGVYTDGDANFTIAEAAQASIAINTTTAKWGTTILPFAVATLPDGVKAYTCAAKESDTQLTLVEVTALEANKPYIINGEWDETKTGWGLGAAISNTEGWLTGVYAKTDAPVGSYVLQNNAAGVGFYLVADGKQPTVGANRCYLTVSDAARAFYLLDSEATAIKAIETLTSGEAEIYNAAGARVNGLQKGVNIIRKANGQSYKVMVK